MDYKEAKKLLFDENVRFDFQMADEIISLMSKPRMLSLLIKADKDKIYLNQYKKFDDENFKHIFERSEFACFSYKVVEKFFETNDEIIILAFIQVLHSNLFKKAEEHLVFQWPYFTNKIIKYTSFSVLEELIYNRFFVFDFENDKNGFIFEKLIRLTENDDLSKELLAINSFNIDAFIERLEQNPSIEPVDFARLTAYSAHYFPGFTNLYGSFRKLFIDYIYFGMKAQDLFVQAKLKANGIFQC